MKEFPLSLLLCKVGKCDGKNAIAPELPCPHCAEVTA